MEGTRLHALSPHLVEPHGCNKYYDIRTVCYVIGMCNYDVIEFGFDDIFKKWFIP